MAKGPEYQLGRLRSAASSKQGVLISTEYLGSWTKLEFEDKAGNRFLQYPAHILRGVWSPFEAKNRHDPERSLSRLREIAEAKGGKLISTVFVNNNTKLEFEDADGNRFWMRPSHVLQGHWSPYEAKLVRDADYHLAELRRIAESRGGKLISTVYVNSLTPLEFEDAAGNRFWSTPNNIKRGQWSPHEGLVSEPICRQAMEHLFGDAFPSRWDVVRRPNGNKLQLDGYNEELHLAFEYQGFFHGQSNVQARDGDKRAACAAAGITLIAVPEFARGKNHRADYVIAHVAEAVRAAYAAAGRPEPGLQLAGFSVDLSRINHCVRQHEIVSKLAEKRGGKLLSKEYVDDSTKLEFQDAAGRSFWLSPGALKQGRWSPYESKHVYDNAYHYAEIVSLTRLRGGRVISPEYKSALSKMEIEDASGNRFEARPNTLKKGHWSPYETYPGGGRFKIADGRRTVRLRSGAEVVYDIRPDGSLRIREATSADSLTRRRWAWDREDGPVIGRWTRASTSEEFRLVGAETADGEQVQVRGAAQAASAAPSPTVCPAR